ncbi:MAG: 3-methyl-2-oxobutanoate hydroxymethyltransferase, partial [Paracoccaceae bacterium]
LFAEDVLGYTKGHRPRHAKAYRDFAAEYQRLQMERILAFEEFIYDVNSGTYAGADHVVPIKNEIFEAFLKRMDN